MKAVLATLVTTIPFVVLLVIYPEIKPLAPVVSILATLFGLSFI